MPLPRVAIVGRPNVGKSSLLNRLSGRRVAIVEPTAGVTRDRVAVEIEHGGRRFELVDMGGLGLVDEALLKEHIDVQIQIALDTADLILFVVDAKEGRVPGDDFVAERLRKLAKPTLLVANKIESWQEEMSAGAWAALGFGAPIQVSAIEGFGATDLLDRTVAALPPRQAEEDVDRKHALAFAVVGKRNAGKSTLVNWLAGEPRVIVSELPGTTRDSIDVMFELDGVRMLAIDTAGVRKKSSVQDAIELFSHSRATESIRRADVVIHLFDVREEVSQVDKALAMYCAEHHKPVLLVGNKLDLAPELDLEQWDEYLRQQLPGLRQAPVAFISAQTGQNVLPMLGLLGELREQSRRQIATPDLNRVLQKAKERLMPQSRGQFPKLYYGTQIGTEPITLLVFVNEPKLFHGQYERYLQHLLGERFDCAEVPIRFVFRRRERVQLDER
jgi:GTP-binding protein